MRSGAPEWHERRRHSIGASDSPIILGVSPYADACRLNLAWQKRGLIPVESLAAELDIGHRLEAVGRAWLEDTVGGTVDYVDGRDFVQVRACTTCVVPAQLSRWSTETSACVVCGAWAVPVHATLDGRMDYEGHHAVVEHKLVRFNNPCHDDWWNRPNAVPLSVQIQCQHQMLVAGAERALVVLFSQKTCDFELRVIEADEGCQQWLIKQLATWWQRYVVGEEDPQPGYNDGTAEAVRARWPMPEPGKAIALGDEWLEVVHHWEDSKAHARQHAKDAARLKGQLDLEMGDAAIAVLPDNRQLKRTITRDGRRLLRVGKAH